MFLTSDSLNYKLKCHWIPSTVSLPSKLLGILSLQLRSQINYFEGHPINRQYYEVSVFPSQKRYLHICWGQNFARCIY